MAGIIKSAILKLSMAKKKVIYWHRSGLRVYEVVGTSAKLLREIESVDLTEIQENLSFLKNGEVCLLLSDEISYLIKNDLGEDSVVDEGFRDRLLKVVKADIPEDFSDFFWDYKIEDSEGKKEVLIFAPIAEVQNKINELSKNLGIKFVVIEPESIALKRDPNPVVGITQKNDVKGKDENVLNIVVDEKPVGNNNKLWWGIISVLSVVLIGLIYYLFVLNLNKN